MDGGLLFLSAAWTGKGSGVFPSIFGTGVGGNCFSLTGGAVGGAGVEMACRGAGDWLLSSGGGVVFEMTAAQEGQILAEAGIFRPQNGHRPLSGLPLSLAFSAGAFASSELPHDGQYNLPLGRTMQQNGHVSCPSGAASSWFSS